MDLKGKKFFILGAARSGISSALFLLKHEALVVLSDLKDYETLKKEGYGIELLNEKENIDLILGRHPEEKEVAQCEMLILSPGVPPTVPACDYAEKNNIEVISEIEFANIFFKGSVIGITGTNGKTTTTYLTGALLSEANVEAKVCGNIGYPFIDFVDESNEQTCAVLEMSSFQLSMQKEIKPKVAIITNITPDHLDRHLTMDNYIDAKANIFKNMNSDDTLILNYDDDNVRKLAERASCSIKYFSLKNECADSFLVNNKLCIRQNDSVTELIDINELKILGNHNVANAMCAVLAALVYNANIESIRKALQNFQPVEHRVEFVREFDGVKYINDSKGTNPDASITAINAMNCPTILLMGGYDKHSDFNEIMQLIKQKVKLIIVFGQTQEKIIQCAEENNYFNFIKADDMKQAINIAKDNAVSGDAVLLSPACASWGMFENFEERGEQFKQTVKSFS